MPLWPNKRETLARVLGRVGFVSLLERLGRRPGLVVLCYHRLGDGGKEPFYAPLVSASPESFREQIRRLRNVFQVLSLEQAVESLAEDGPREPSALVTFDDGYRDNLDLAAPILTELGVPAAVFLTSGFLDGHLPWWDHVAAVVKRCELARLRLDRPERLDLACSEGPLREAALTAIIAAYLRADQPDDPALIEHLEERASVRLDAQTLAGGLFLSWDDARRWVKAGFSVGRTRGRTGGSRAWAWRSKRPNWSSRRGGSRRRSVDRLRRWRIRSAIPRPLTWRPGEWPRRPVIERRSRFGPG